MTPDQLDEARAWVALPDWRWFPGMLVQWERPGGAGGQQVMPTMARLVELSQPMQNAMLGCLDVQQVYRGSLPVVTDPATKGCLEALAREITGRADLSTVRSEGQWLAVYWQGPETRVTLGRADRETQALLKACQRSLT